MKKYLYLNLQIAILTLIITGLVLTLMTSWN